MLNQSAARIEASSENRGWKTIFASLQREQPSRAHLAVGSNALLVMSVRGPAKLVYRTRGRVTPRFPGPGDVFFLPPGHDCEVDLHTPLDTVHIHLHSELFQELTNDVRIELEPLFGEAEVITYHLMSVVEQMLREEESSNALIADSVALAIASRLILTRSPGSGPQRRGRARQLNTRQIRVIREFIEENLSTDIRLDELAGMCGMSPAHFIRRFKATTGVPPHRYVLQLRVEQARRLLAGSSIRSLPEIALACGFSHQQHLTSAFRRFTGLTPAAYRRSAQV
ncbi:helix-turn-helix domain-containing protein [Bradyrhizobium nitroreducens]|uniref:helix-turn-helix domain-containing protein n=1 Tax=Bradyrhizobium nitroreducens TaxID=709803 RepID=UPI001374B9B4|nr:AraC family transcriptional regulator [Bradyrhizobium nitroreducens]